MKKQDHPPIPEKNGLPHKERALLEQITAQTAALNLNNVTRTMAYLNFYLHFPEIHWAFLGHAVSRNGGWNMTDLKGDLLAKLLNEQRREDYFHFLERGNWLIFQDVYPQFLLYAESVRQNKNLFYLLPYLHVSFFMEVAWNDFWKRGDSYTLAIAQVINEQSYLEERVVKNPVYKEKVLYTVEFLLQELLSFNHILFPYSEPGHEGGTALAGITLEYFGSLHEQIVLGKRLYGLLFSDHRMWRKVLKWCVSRPHTGSRKDYWPHLFNDVHEGLPGTLYKRLKKCQLKKGVPRFYSPKLTFAWKNVVHEEAEKGDWFNRWEVVYYLEKDQEKKSGEIEGDYCETLKNLELAAMAKKALSK
ncbi:DUF2515 family protein [Siminovitchia sp. 179-K 8D1 HS]|uniref:DUF2515 family protein n=1 Tax=Siminovitchia sp. 179-K 8D1 HS TaxID=3142385 RepID=UPI0039A36B27